MYLKLIRENATNEGTLQKLTAFLEPHRVSEPACADPTSHAKKWGPQASKRSPREDTLTETRTHSHFRGTSAKHTHKKSAK